MALTKRHSRATTTINIGRRGAMTDGTFKIVVRSGSAPGAAARIVLSKLAALQDLYDASVTAFLHPGAARTRVPDGAADLATLVISGATPTSSLAIAMSEPFVPDGYDGKYGTMPRGVSPKFRGALKAGAEKNVDVIYALFPEKADQIRIFRAIKELSPGGKEDPVSIQGIDGIDNVIIFRLEHKEWADSSIPSLAPEAVTRHGMIRAGKLGSDATFRIYDGSSSVLLRPDQKGIARLAEFFGKVVEVSGLATYAPNGNISEINEISMVEPFEYRTREIEDGLRTFTLTEEISYRAEASIDTRGFTLINEGLGSISFGNTLSDAIEETERDFSAIWDDIAMADESEIHESALPLRMYLKGLVSDVKDILDDF
jgi:hypothetical protein